MPFSDKDLANKMKELLVSTGVVSDIASLESDHTEVAVSALTTTEPPKVDAARFLSRYVPALDEWMKANGGGLSSTTGTNVPGRTPGSAVNGLMMRALYNDAFADVAKHMASDGFLPVKALSNHLRFIFTVLEDDEESSSSSSSE